MYQKIKKLLFWVLFVSLGACQSAGETSQITDASYPSLFLNLEATNITGSLKVYDSQGELSGEADLVINDDLVSSESVDLERQSYYFVLGFYYTLDDGSSVGIANVVLDESLSSGSNNFSYQETDISYDNPADVNNDLSASFSLGGYEVTNLDLDGDGVSNIREILAGSDPLDAADLPDTLSVNLSEGQTVQDTVTIIAQYYPADEAQVLLMESPSGFEDQNGLADIFLISWDTTAYDEDENVNLSFLAQNISGELTEKSITVIVDNYPNIVLEADTLIQNGESVTLSWAVDNYSSAAMDQEVGSLESTGSLTLTPAQTTTYTLTATRTNDDGQDFTVEESLTIVVNDAPVYSSHTTNLVGQNPSDDDGVNFSWQSSDANSDTLTSTISVYEGEGCVSDVVQEQSTTESALAMSGLLPRTAYSWRVDISDGNGGETASECYSFTTGDEDLVAWWPMDEGTGTALSDLSGNEYDWTLSGGSSSPVWDSTGIINTGLFFDGINDVSTLPSSITTSSLDDLSQSISFDFWVYLDPDDANLSGSHSYLLTNVANENDVLGGGGYGIFYEDRSSEQTIKFYGVTADETYFEAVAGDNAINNADWYHVTATYNASADGFSEARIYVNGDLKGSDHFDDEIKSTSSRFTLGDISQAESAVNFSGSIDELAIYARALNASEVREFCTRTGTGNCAASDTPILVSPAPGEEFSPTEVFFSWEAGEIPENLSLDHFELCYTSGTESSLDDEDECANRTLVYDTVHSVELDSTITSTQTYYWKVKTCYDSSCSTSSSYSSLSSFSVDDSVQGLWRFDEASGTNSENETGDSSLDVGLVGSPLWQGSGVTGDGSAISLDGVDDRASVPSAVMTDTSEEMSFEIWAYIDEWIFNTEDYVYLMMNTDENSVLSVGGYGLFIDARSWMRENAIEFYGATTNGTDYFDAVSDPLTLDAVGWYHIVGTYSVDRGEANLYLNGELVATDEFSSSIPYNSYGLVIGAGFDSTATDTDLHAHYFGGSLDNIAVYNRALSDTNVLNNYCAVLSLRDEDNASCE